MLDNKEAAPTMEYVVESVSISYPGKGPHVVLHVEPSKIYFGNGRINGTGDRRPVLGVTYSALMYQVVEVAVQCLMSQQKTPEIALYDGKIQVGLSVTPATPECQEIVDNSLVFGSKKLIISAFHVDAKHAVDPESDAYKTFKAALDEHGVCTLWLVPPHGDIAKAKIGVTVREIKNEPLKYF